MRFKMVRVEKETVANTMSSYRIENIERKQNHFKRKISVTDGNQLRQEDHEKRASQRISS